MPSTCAGAAVLVCKGFQKPIELQEAALLGDDRSVDDVIWEAIPAD